MPAPARRRHHRRRRQHHHNNQHGSHVPLLRLHNDRPRVRRALANALAVLVGTCDSSIDPAEETMRLPLLSHAADAKTSPTRAHD